MSVAADQRDEARVFVGLKPCATASASSTLGSALLNGLRSFNLGGDSRPLALSASLLQRSHKNSSYRL